MPDRSPRADALDTTSGVHPPGAGPRRTRARGATLAAMAIVVALGLSGVLGVRSTTAAASGRGYVLSVTHAAVARAGWDVPLVLEVRAPDGFGSEVVVQLDAAYLDIYETQAFTPEPTGQVRDAQWLRLTFDPPEGDVLRIAYDADIQPYSQVGRTARVSVLAGDRPAVTVPVRTVLLP